MSGPPRCAVTDCRARAGWLSPFCPVHRARLTVETSTRLAAANANVLRAGGKITGYISDAAMQEYRVALIAARQEASAGLSPAEYRRTNVAKSKEAHAREEAASAEEAADEAAAASRNS